MLDIPRCLCEMIENGKSTTVWKHVTFLPTHSYLHLIIQQVFDMIEVCLKTYILFMARRQSTNMPFIVGSKL